MRGVLALEFRPLRTVLKRRIFASRRQIAVLKRRILASGRQIIVSPTQTFASGRQITVLQTRKFTRRGEMATPGGQGTPPLREAAARRREAQRSATPSPSRRFAEG